MQPGSAGCRMQTCLDECATGFYRAGNAFANRSLGFEGDYCGVRIVPVTRFYWCLKIFEFRGIHVFFHLRGRVSRPAMGPAKTTPALERKLGIGFSNVKQGRGAGPDGYR